jgi:hypothetical protein
VPEVPGAKSPEAYLLFLHPGFEHIGGLRITKYKLPHVYALPVAPWAATTGVTAKGGGKCREEMGLDRLGEVDREREEAEEEGYGQVRVEVGGRRGERDQAQGREEIVFAPIAGPEPLIKSEFLATI